MKKTILMLTALLFFARMEAQFTKANLQATGLTCAMCNNAINKALQKLSFVGSVKSDIKNSAFDIVFKPNTSMDIDALKKAVEDAGFSIGALKLTGNFNGIKVAAEHHVQIGEEQFCFLNINERTLNGEETLTVIDKNYVTAKEFKKLSSSSKLSCLQSGKAGSCCGLEGNSTNTKVYHVTI